MELTIWYEREQKQETILFSGKTIAELLFFLKINPEIVLVVRNNEVLTPDEKVQSKDRLELLSVVSGG